MALAAREGRDSHEGAVLAADHQSSTAHRRARSPNGKATALKAIRGSLPPAARAGPTTIAHKKMPAARTTTVMSPATLSRSLPVRGALGSPRTPRKKKWVVGEVKSVHDIRQAAQSVTAPERRQSFAYRESDIA